MSVQIILIAFFGACVLCLFIFVVKSLITPKRIEGIQKYLKQGKNSAAIKLAKGMISKDPGDFHAHYYLGKAYLADNKPELALMEFKTVNQKALFDDTLPEVEFRRLAGQLYSRFNQPDEALKEYLLLTKLDPANADNCFNAARIFEQKGKTDQALIYYQKTVVLNKRHVKAHAALGLMLFRAKQFAEAKKEINYAIQLSPDTFSSYYYLGKILKESKDYAGAIAAFEKALRDPEFKQRALMESGSCYMAAQNPEKAIVEFDRAVKSSKDEGSQETLYARYFLASCYEKTRKIDLAISQWEKIYTKNHTFKDVPAKLAEYRDLQSNDSMKEYLTCNTDTFYEICKKVAEVSFGYSVKSTEPSKQGCKMLATEGKSENWLNVRQQTAVLLFFRDTNLIEDTVLRLELEEMKKMNYSKCVVCTSSGFTSTAANFAENRPFELIQKEALESALSKANI